jgi:hypothetical protein
MQKAFENLEAMAASLSGPVIAAFHPPKNNKDTISGSAQIENSTTAIWGLKKIEGDLRQLTNERIKGKGEGYSRTYFLEEIELAKTDGTPDKDEIGQVRTGVVAMLEDKTELRMAVAEKAETKRSKIAHAVRKVIEKEKAKPKEKRRYSMSLDAIGKALAGTERDGHKFASLSATKNELRANFWDIGNKTAKLFVFEDGKVLEARKPGKRWAWIIRAG